MTDMINVGCRVPNGLKLRVSGRVDSAEEPGKKVLREIAILDIAGPVSSHGERPGPAPSEAITEVDAKLFGLWMAENKDSDLVTSGAVFEVKPPKVEQPAKADEKPAPAKSDKADEPSKK